MSRIRPCDLINHIDYCRTHHVSMQIGKYNARYTWLDVHNYVCKFIYFTIIRSVQIVSYKCSCFLPRIIHYMTKLYGYDRMTMV